MRRSPRIQPLFRSKSDTLRAPPAAVGYYALYYNTTKGICTSHSGANSSRFGLAVQLLSFGGLACLVENTKVRLTLSLLLADLAEVSLELGITCPARERAKTPDEPIAKLSVPLASEMVV